MTVHSNILLHWTGKRDIESKPKSDRPALYLDRLVDYYENGLYARRTSEDTVRKKKVKNIVRLCFTEIRLSQAQKHARRYGRLAIGFMRTFMMDKGGRPVIYIPFHAGADGRLLEDSIGDVYERSQGKTHKSAMWIMAHVKRMRNERRDDFYEEMEWRLVYGESLGNRHFMKDASVKGVHRLKFQAKDVKIIVFPDEETTRKSLQDERMKKHFSRHMPSMVTLRDCSNF